MSGSSELFYEAGYHYPKNLVEVDGIPMIEKVIRGLEPLRKKTDRVIYIINESEARHHHTDSIIKLLDPSACVIKSTGSTSGAACSAMLAIEFVDNEDPLVIINGDILLECGLPEAIDDFKKRDLDGGIMVFDGIHPRWSYVRINESHMVIEAAEKHPISRLATVGVYYYKQGQEFITSTQAMIRKNAMVDGKFYICPSYNEMVLLQRNIGIFKVENNCHFSFSTPQSIRLYNNYTHNKEGKF